MDRAHHAHPRSAWGTSFPHFDTIYAAPASWSTSEPSSVQLRAFGGQAQAPTAATSAGGPSSSGARDLGTNEPNYRARERLPPLRSTFGDLASSNASQNHTTSDPETAAPPELLRAQGAAAAATTVTPSIEATYVEASLPSQPPVTARSAMMDHTSPPGMVQNSSVQHALIHAQTHPPWFPNPFLSTEQYQRAVYGAHHSNGPIHSSRTTNFHFPPHVPLSPYASLQTANATTSRAPSSTRRRPSRIARDGRPMAHLLPHVGSNSAPRRTISSREREQFERDAQILRGAIRTQNVASGAALRSLQSVEVKDLPEDERWCMICYNQYGEESPEGINEAPLRIPNCKHVFGDHCLKRWLGESDHCPYCRDKLPATTKRAATAREDYRQYMRARALMFTSEEDHGRYHDAVNLALAQSDSDDFDSDAQDTRPASSISPRRPTIPQRRERRSAPVDSEDNQRRTRVRLNDWSSRSHVQASISSQAEASRFLPTSDRHSEGAGQPQNVARTSNEQQMPHIAGHEASWSQAFGSRYLLQSYGVPHSALNEPSNYLGSTESLSSYPPGPPTPTENPIGRGTTYARARARRQTDPSAFTTPSNGQELFSNISVELLDPREDNDGAVLSSPNH